MEFSHVGFDIKVWPWNGNYNVDDTGWDSNEDRHSELATLFSLSLNEYSLLEIGNQELLDAVCEWVLLRDDCNLVSVQFPQGPVSVLDTKFGYSTSSITLDLSKFTCRGLDVCDFDGLFSALHNPQLVRSSALIPEVDVLIAAELTQTANVLDPGHSPNVVARVSSLK